MLNSAAKVCIWVAARNEALTLPALLQSLDPQIQTLPYAVQVLVGNDQSTDHTASVLHAAMERYSWLHVVLVPEHVPAPHKLAAVSHAKAKARVLNYLASITTEALPAVDTILITDADIILAPNWITGLVQALKQYHMVSGITTMVPGSMFAALQGQDWLLALHTVSALQRINVGITALGNNMGFRWHTYKLLGGYEVLPATLVEDFQLYTLFRAAGFSTTNLYEHQLLNFSYAPDTKSSFLKQRTRWLTGGLQTAGAVQWVFFAQFLWYPAALALGFWNLEAALLMAGSRYAFTVFMSYYVLLLAGWPLKPAWHRPGSARMSLTPWLFEVYFHWAYLSTFWHAYQHRNQQLEWKDRPYAG